MEFLHLLVDADIEVIPLMILDNKLNTEVMSNSVLLVKHDGKQKFIKCIREYYSDPVDGKKVKKPNMSNFCAKLQNTFNITGCSNFDCKTCHKKAIENYYAGQLKLLKKKK